MIIWHNRSNNFESTRCILSNVNLFMSSGTIRCSKETQTRLKGYGRFGESFEKVVTRLLDEVENHGV